MMSRAIRMVDRADAVLHEDKGKQRFPSANADLMDSMWKFGMAGQFASSVLEGDALAQVQNAIVRQTQRAQQLAFKASYRGNDGRAVGRATGRMGSKVVK